MARQTFVRLKPVLFAAAVVAWRVAAPTSLYAQNAAPPELHARHIATPPILDGVLDDEAWSESPLPLDKWVSYNPMRGEPSAQQTKVWIAYDDRALYLAFQCLDSEPDKIRTTISRRDNVWADDWVGFSLDSSRAGQLAYHLFVNPSGIQMDGLQSGSNGEDMSPDWVWQSAGHVGPDGWSAEIRVPIENLRFRSGADVRMGILFWRRISRSGVSSSWPEMLPGKWVFESNTPVVFDELHSRRLAEVIPSATFSSNQTRASDLDWNKTRSRGDVGVSVKYGITSAVTLDATVNPDFSQVESDAFEVEVNQRYPIFFSEKRPFFMEGLGLFNLAGTGGDATMRTAVHTRRIIDPSAGLKLTGASGRHTFGVLSSADTSPPGERQRVFTIGREVINFGRGQYAGLLATDVEYGVEHNRVFGGDGSIRRGEHFTANGSFLSSESRTLSGEVKRGVGTQGTYEYSTRRYVIIGQLEHYDQGFQMDTAFVNRVGITRGWQYQDLNFYPSHPKFKWIKRVNPFFWMTLANDRNQGGSEAFYLPALRMNFTRAGSLRLDFANGHETFAGKRFETGRMKADGNVQLTQWLELNLAVDKGPAIFYDADAPFQGDRHGVNFRVGLQPNSKFNSHTSYSYVKFDDHRTGLNVYRVHIIILRNTYQFTPQFFVRAITQYDSSREIMLGDFLASYELSPGTVVHGGYGSLLGREDLVGYHTTARAFFFKASYLARF